MNYQNPIYILENRPFYSADLSDNQRAVLTMLITNGALSATAIQHKGNELSIGGADRYARGLHFMNLNINGKRIKVDRRPIPGKGKQVEYYIRPTE